MLFSIAIPAYKPEFLAEALSSVCAQTFQDWELVVVDDCSPADLRAIAKPFLSDPRVRYFRNEKNIGAMDVVDNWNKCLGYCSGDYVICMGDDDRLLPDCLQDLAALIARHPGLGLYHIQAEIIDAEGKVVERTPLRPEVESALDMLDRRWRVNSRQFIGDWCFDLPRLKAAGGFYKLPLAWGSDDISAFRAAIDGIGNTQRLGFQYRRTPLTISSAEYVLEKVEAMASAADWFEAALSSFTPEDEAQRVKLKELKIRVSRYYAYLRADYIKVDMAHHPGHLSYWLGKRHNCRLSAARIWVQFCKSQILHALGRL